MKNVNIPRCRFIVFIINSEQISHIALVFPLLDLKKWMTTELFFQIEKLCNWI